MNGTAWSEKRVFLHYYCRIFVRNVKGSMWKLSYIGKYQKFVCLEERHISQKGIAICKRSQIISVTSATISNHLISVPTSVAHPKFMLILGLTTPGKLHNKIFPTAFLDIQKIPCVLTITFRFDITDLKLFQFTYLKTE